MNQRSFKDPSYQPTYASLGYFFIWFSSAEEWITLTLRHLCGATDQEKFSILVKGMDARVKVERLRKASKISIPLGTNYKDWLSQFEKKSIPLRNKISHRWLLPSTDASGFRMVTSVKDLTNDGKIKANLPSQVLLDHAEWLNSFSFYLDEAFTQSFQTKVLEIALPSPHPPTV